MQAGLLRNFRSARALATAALWFSLASIAAAGDAPKLETEYYRIPAADAGIATTRRPPSDRRAESPISMCRTDGPP